MTAIVHTINGNEYTFTYCRGYARDGVLTIEYESGHGYLAGRVHTQFPLTSVERWTSSESY